MRVSYEWVRELVAVSATPEELADRLTMIGFEVEGAETVQNDTVFEVNVTPNRPDCLSILGIARESAAAYKTAVKIPEHQIKGAQPMPDFSVDILNPELCNRYAGRVIREVKIADSPEWIKTRLEKSGIRSINNVVDITNYVLLEFGHPLHAFDADKLHGKKIVVKTAGPDNKIRTLDGIERALPDDALLIWDSKRPVAIAGIMGGSETEVTGRTKNIFLESAYFDPFSIRRTSKRLGLTSESSYRFERGTDKEFLEKALDRAAFLIQEIAGGTVHELIDNYPVKDMPEPVEARVERINRLLGISLTGAEMLHILGRLGIPAEDKGTVFTVFPPAHRRDIKRESDIAEEIARIYGYSSIPVTNPRSPLPSGRLSMREYNKSRIRDIVRKTGFTEVINYSFMGASTLSLIAIPDPDVRRKTISLSNPLSQEECMLRTTVAPALIANLAFNLDRGIKDIRLFEIAKVFINNGERLPSEELRLGGILYREKSPALWKEDVPGFFLAKGALEALFEELKISGCSYVASAEPFFHQGKASDIFLSGTRIGYIGILSPEVVETYGLKKQKPEIVLFELDLEVLLASIPLSMRYRPVPKYPSIERDIALVVTETMPSSYIHDIIRAYPTNLIEDISVFDSFKGGNIPRGKKSTAFNIIYRSAERTLRDEEIETLHASITEYLVEKTGGELRK
jgi:phenylalanyl-tRNA synthetase beta chain